MVNYSCEICNKIFTKKSHYNQHQKRKTKCNNNEEKLKNIINQVVDNKINLLIDTIPNNNNNNIVDINNKEIIILINEKKNKLSK